MARPPWALQRVLCIRSCCLDAALRRDLSVPTAQQTLEQLLSQLQVSPAGEWAVSGQNYIRSSGSIRLLVKTTAPALCLYGDCFPWWNACRLWTGCEVFLSCWCRLRTGHPWVMGRCWQSQWPTRDALCYCRIHWRFLLDQLLSNGLVSARCWSGKGSRQRQKGKMLLKVEESRMPSSAGWITNHPATVFVTRLFSVFLATDLWDHFAIFSCLWLGTFLLGTCWVGRSTYPELQARGWADPTYPVNYIHFLSSLSPWSISNPGHQQQFWKCPQRCSSKTQENKHVPRKSPDSLL